MRIILIRHGDPDYQNDGLTEKGRREAELLSERIAKWDNITQIYCSPLGRAQETASYTLARLGREAVTYPWLREFSYMVDDPTTGRHGVPWDFMPEYWTEIEEMYDKKGWRDTEIYRSNPELLPAYDEVCSGIDNILAGYGYQRYHNYYKTTHTEVPDGPDYTLVFFCHLGVSCVIMSHLLGISPVALFHGLYLAPTCLSILACEERIPGKAIFRAQVIGDTTHLHDGKEPISAMGYFTDVFQQ